MQTENSDVIKTAQIDFLASKFAQGIFRSIFVTGQHTLNKYSLQIEKENEHMEKSQIRTKEDVIRLLQNKTEFERTVLVKTFEIPRGKVSTYKRIATKIGKPRAYRAVANALHKNPLAPVVPCQRVVSSNGNIVGTKEAIEARRRLLEKEGIPLKGNRVKLSPEILF